MVSRLRPAGLFREMSEAVVGDMPGFSAGSGRRRRRDLYCLTNCPGFRPEGSTETQVSRHTQPTPASRHTVDSKLRTHHLCGTASSS